MNAKEPTHIPQAHHGAHDPEAAVRTYILIFAALGTLTLATVGVAYMQLPHGAGVVIALIIAAVKVYLIAAFFMHLRMEGKLINYSLAVTFGLVLILVVFVLPDVGVHELERHEQEVKRHEASGHLAYPPVEGAAAHAGSADAAGAHASH